MAESSSRCRHNSSFGWLIARETNNRVEVRVESSLLGLATEAKRQNVDRVGVCAPRLAPYHCFRGQLLVTRLQSSIVECLPVGTVVDPIYRDGHRT